MAELVEALAPRPITTFALDAVHAPNMHNQWMCPVSRELAAYYWAVIEMAHDFGPVFHKDR